MTLLLLLLLLY